VQGMPMDCKQEYKGISQSLYLTVHKKWIYSTTTTTCDLRTKIKKKKCSSCTNWESLKG